MTPETPNYNEMDTHLMSGTQVEVTYNNGNFAMFSWHTSCVCNRGV